MEFTQIFNIAKPIRWAPDSPALYRAKIEVEQNGKLVDTIQTAFGIRNVQINATKGLLLNGEPLKLKGGRIFNDNGPLGAAAIDRAEERRVELAKAAGFNAIWTCGAPPSPAFLDACDRLGMLVIDEAFDVWTQAKQPDDYHLYFKDWWRRDLEAILLRDRNHPCVILWSVGNEIPERAEPAGVALCQDMVQLIRRLDSSRMATAAIGDIGTKRNWTNSAQAFASLGVGGYNYLWQEYGADHKKYPWRIMLGSASYPKEAFDSWQAAQSNAWVLGDFVWTALDYLGDSGRGHAILDNEKETATASFPWHNAWCGDLDICGFKKPQHAYREILWGMSNIALAVHAPVPEGRTENVNAWGWPDERSSWTWPGCEGKEMDISVYTTCDSVRLELNGKPLGVQSLSKTNKLTARFRIPYQPGELRAVGLTKGKPVATANLVTTGLPKKLRLTADRSTIQANRNDLAYVTVEVVDDEGRLVPNAEATIRFNVSGAGELAATGNSSPNEPANFQEPTRKTFQGRCLAILRSNGRPGKIRLRAEADGLTPAETTVKTR
jgi:beta-galactosidase